MFFLSKRQRFIAGGHSTLFSAFGKLPRRFFYLAAAVKRNKIKLSFFSHWVRLCAALFFSSLNLTRFGRCDKVSSIFYQIVNPVRPTIGSAHSPRALRPFQLRLPFISGRRRDLLRRIHFKFLSIPPDKLLLGVKNLHALAL
jgi:hypothetical protein